MFQCHMQRLSRRVTGAGTRFFVRADVGPWQGAVLDSQWLENAAEEIFVSGRFGPATVGPPSDTPAGPVIPISLKTVHSSESLEGKLQLSYTEDRCLVEVIFVLPWQLKRESRWRVALDEIPALLSIWAATAALGLRFVEWFRRRSVERSVRRLVLAISEKLVCTARRTART